MKFQSIIIVLFLISMGLVVVVSVPNLKRSAKEFFLDEKRIILGKVQGEVTSAGEKFVILKIKQKDEIFVEVYKEEDKSEHLNFVQKITIPEKNEGSFTFRGEITNLAFADIDEDSFMEILVPAFSTDMTPRLHTFKFNSTNSTFEPMQAAP
jgi:hypothetical protein